MTRKGDVGQGASGKFLSVLDKDIVRGMLRGFPCLCVGTPRPVYHKGKWSWAEGWHVFVQDGLFLRKEGSNFNLYWEE